MKMIRNMALSYGGKFYATQGGPVRLGYSVSEGQLPASWETEVVTNYPQRITKDTIQFTFLDSDACGITGALSDFDADDADALCAKNLVLYVIVGDETSGLACDLTGENIGTLCVKKASAYVTNVAPSSITVDGERVETLNVTFRTTTPFVLWTTPDKLHVPIYEAEYAFGGYTCAGSDRAEGAYDLRVLYGDTMPALTTTEVEDPADVEGHVFEGLADCDGKLYYTPPVSGETTTWVVATGIVKFDRLVPISLHYKWTPTLLT